MILGLENIYLCLQLMTEINLSQGRVAFKFPRNEFKHEFRVILGKQVSFLAICHDFGWCRGFARRHIWDRVGTSSGRGGGNAVDGPSAR